MGVRFAPSPTGAFHIGNFRTAWISFQWARALGLPWVLRFEDIDRPRVVEGAMEHQLREMEVLGLGPQSGIVVRVYRQSDRASRQWSLFTKAVSTGAVYPCFCSRKEVQEGLERIASAPHGSRVEEAVYSGRCGNLEGAELRRRVSEYSHSTVGWRFRGEDPGGAQDHIVARTRAEDSSHLARVLERHEGPAQGWMPSYHWACAIDDHDGRYTMLVRAVDLESVVPLHRAIHAWVDRIEGTNVPFPAVFHCALVTRNDGTRLEKRTRGVTLPELMERGYSATRVIDCFEKSFQLNAKELAPGAIFGEASLSLTLAELGIRLD